MNNPLITAKFKKDEGMPLIDVRPKGMEVEMNGYRRRHLFTNILIKKFPFYVGAKRYTACFTRKMIVRIGLPLKKYSEQHTQLEMPWYKNRICFSRHIHV
jgi:hypothetical protein